MLQDRKIGIDTKRFQDETFRRSDEKIKYKCKTKPQHQNNSINSLQAKNFQVISGIIGRKLNP